MKDSIRKLLREALEQHTNRGYIIDKGDKIIKVTTDAIEYENALRLINNPHENFVKYDSAEPYKEINGKQTYKLVMDKVDTLGDEEWDVVDLIQQSIGKQEYFLDKNKRNRTLKELKNNPEWYEDYGDFNKVMDLIKSMYNMYSYADNNGFKLFDLKGINMGRDKKGNLVHFDLGSG